MAPKQTDTKGFWNTFAFLTKVSYGGIIGKIAAIAIVFFLLVICAIFAVHGNPFFVAGLVLMSLAALIFIVRRIESIFRSNPEMATLEGTEVIRYQQAVLKSKNEAPVRVIEITPDPELKAPTSLQLGGSEEDE